MVWGYNKKTKCAYNFRFDKWISILLGNMQIPRTIMCTTQKTCSSHLNVNTIVWSSLQISLLVFLEGSLLLPVQAVNAMWNIIALGRYLVLLTQHAFCVWFRSIAPHLVWSYPRNRKLVQLQHSSVPLMEYLLSQGSQEGSSWWFLSLLQNGQMTERTEKWKICVSGLRDSNDQMDIRPLLCAAWSVWRLGLKNIGKLKCSEMTIYNSINTSK